MSRLRPLARRIARELGVDLGSLEGSRAEGRIVKADVSWRRPPAARQVCAGGRGGARCGGERPPPVGRCGGRRATAAARRGPCRSSSPNRTQQVIARRMARARRQRRSRSSRSRSRSTPRRRSSCASSCAEQAEPLPSINDLVIKACALALRAHPRVNSAYVGRSASSATARVNIGMAVASEGSLVVPTIFDADVPARWSRSPPRRVPLAARVRDGSVSPPRGSRAAPSPSPTSACSWRLRRLRRGDQPARQAAILAVGAALAPCAIVGEDGSVSARRVTKALVPHAR